MARCLYLGREKKNFSGNCIFYVNAGIPFTEREQSFGDEGYKVVRAKVSEAKYHLFDSSNIFAEFDCEVVNSSRQAFVNWSAYDNNHTRDVESIPQVQLFEIELVPNKK